MAARLFSISAHCSMESFSEIYRDSFPKGQRLSLNFFINVARSQKLHVVHCTKGEEDRRLSL